jgi:hypothetical protein
MKRWRAGRVLALALVSGVAAARGGAENRTVPFWPEAVTSAIHAEIDGRAALRTVRDLGRFHRVHGSPGFAAAAEMMRDRLTTAGLGDAIIERFPADGRTGYAHFRSYLGWDAKEASLSEVSPHARPIARFPDLPVALADYSQDADVTAELIDVGQGSTPADYTGKEVEGRLVLASGPLPLVHRRAVEERGAAGLLSDYPNQRTAWSGDDRDLVRWGHLSPYQTRNAFAFMLSARQSQELRSRRAAGEKIVLHARVRARMVPATYDVVTATIPGKERPGEEVVLTAHLCHESAGANDNASGSAAILEIARALQSAVARGTLAPPRRTIRFLWLPEIAGSQAWLVRHSEAARVTVAGIHMDMVGGLLATTHGTFHLSRSAESRPHVVDEIARAWLAAVVRASERYAERGGDAYAGLSWPSGSRESFLADLRGVEMGSDHEVFEEASFAVPMVYFHDWPDVTIHTQKDLPENLDATKMGRVAFLGAGIAWTLAALPDAEASRLLAVTRAGLAERSARAGLRAELADDSRDGALVRREAAAVAAATLRSLAALWPAAAGAARGEEARLPAASVAAPVAGGDGRVPVRNPEVRGPLGVYYYDHLAEVLGPDAERETALGRRDGGEVLAWETLNLVDGRRSVQEIRDVLTGRYAPVPVAEVAEYLDLLARARVVSWK